jgi:hypothetical protein
VQRGQHATRRDFEHRPIAVSPATGRCPIEAPIGGLNQPRVGKLTVGATAPRAKAVNRRQRAARRDFEDCASALGTASIASSSGQRNPREWTTSQTSPEKRNYSGLDLEK